MFQAPSDHGGVRGWKLGSQGRDSYYDPDPGEEQQLGGRGETGPRERSGWVLACVLKDRADRIC